MSKSKARRISAIMREGFYAFDGRGRIGRLPPISRMTWTLILYPILSVAAVAGQAGGGLTPQQKVDQWCGERFNTDRKACTDLLNRWCLQTQANSAAGGSNHEPEICGAYRGAGPAAAGPAPPPVSSQVRVDLSSISHPQ